MRRITAMFLALVMCFSFIGEAAYAEDIFAAMPGTENLQENQPQGDPFRPQSDPFRPQDVSEPSEDVSEQPENIPEQPENKEEPREEEQDTSENPEPGETASEAPADETEETPVFKPELPEGQSTFTVFSSVESFTAGSPATAVLTAVVTRSDTTMPFPENVVWESNMLNVSVNAMNEIFTDEAGLVRTFRTKAEYNGALNTGNVDITATAPGWGNQTVHITVNQGFTVKLVDETGKNFRLVLKDKTENTVRTHETVTFMLMDGENPADSETLQALSMEAAMQADGMEIPVYIKEDENGEFTLYANSELSSILEATGDITVTLKDQSDGEYTVTVGGDAAEYPTVLAEPKAEEGKDYIFYVAHPEDIENQKEDFESKYVYSLPLVTIGGREFNGYTLEIRQGTLPGGGDTSYKRYWKVTIPGKQDTETIINGDIVIDANVRRIEDAGYTVDLSYFSGNPMFVPFGENEKGIGMTVLSPEEENGQEYYFYYDKKKDNASNLHPVYFIGGDGYSLSPLPVSEEPESPNSCLYKMSRITGPAAVTLGYNVSKGLMENNEERLVDLPSGAVLQGQDYKFTVRTFDMTESQLPVYIYAGSTQNLLYPKEDSSVIMKPFLQDELGCYAEFTVPATVITNDIIIEARSDAPVNYRVKFVDSYNAGRSVKIGGTSIGLEYKAFDFTSASFVPGTYNTSPWAPHTGQFEAGRSGFSFEILEMPFYTNKNVPNVDGKSSDAFLAHYNFELTGFGYDFTGSTMGGEPVKVTPGAYIDGHQLFTVNEGMPLTGDVLIRVNLSLPMFECVTIGNSDEKIESRTNKESFLLKNSDGSYSTIGTGRAEPGSLSYLYPTYRYRFELKTKPGEAREVFLSVYNGWTNEFIKYTPYLVGSTGQVTAQIWGDAVNGTIYAKVIGNDEADVYATGVNAEKVSFPNSTKDNCPYYNGCIAKTGTDFVFTVPSDTKVSSVKVGDTTLVEGLEYSYTAVGNEKRYTVPGQHMTGDTVITTTAAPTTYNVTFSGKYEYTRPVGKNESVQFDTVKAGENYSFLLADGILTMYVGAKNSAGRRELVKDTDYTIEGSQITILAASITDDIYIEIAAVRPRRMPMYTSKKKTSSGTELDIETWEYLVLDEGKIMYMLVVQGEPKENEFVCYGNNKMLWVESYDGYVWFEASDERPDDFAIHSYDMVDTLTDEELRFNLSEEADDPKAPVKIPEFEEIFNITKNDKISCDVNEDGKVNEEDLKIMRRIFNCDFEDFDDISMRCFVLADADNSGVLDMCDAEIIKCNFDKDEDENEEK